MFRYLPLVWRNSLRNRRRSILTIGSFAASMCLLGVLMAMYQALFTGEATPAQALRLVVRNKVSLTQPLLASYEPRISLLPGVRAITPWQWFGGTYKDSRDAKNFFARFAVNPATIFLVRPELEIPEEQKQAFLHQQTGAVASSELATKMGWKVGDRINLTGDIFPINPEFTLVGIFKSPDADETFYFSRKYLKEAMGTSSRADEIGAFLVQADSADSVERIAKQVDEMFASSPNQTKSESERAFQLSFASFIGNIKVFLFVICGAVTFTILLVTGNTMAMSVRERIREVGILKTLGYKPSVILGIILGEAAIISLLGGVLGLLLASFMTAVVRSGPAFLQGLKTLSISPLVGFACLLLALLIGVLSSLVPAWNASRTPILDSLRYSG